MMCAWGSHLIEVHQLDHAVELEGVGEAVLASLVANLHQLVKPSLHGNLNVFQIFLIAKQKKVRRSIWAPEVRNVPYGT